MAIFFSDDLPEFLVGFRHVDSVADVELFDQMAVSIQVEQRGYDNKNCKNSEQILSCQGSQKSRLLLVCFPSLCLLREGQIVGGFVSRVTENSVGSLNHAGVNAAIVPSVF